jgi:hypothetical protein
MTIVDSAELIYLDHNVTSPLAPEELDAMLPYLTEEWGDLSSDHPSGHRALRGQGTTSDSPELIASLIDAHPSEVVLMSGGTESNNLAIRGTAATEPAGRSASEAVGHSGRWSSGGPRSEDSVRAARTLAASWAWHMHASWHVRAWGPSRAAGGTLASRCGRHCPSRSEG